MSSPYDLCIERIKYLTEIYEKYPNEPEIIKRAKGIAHTLQKMTIFIRNDELLVGNETSKNLGEKINLDLFTYDDAFKNKITAKKFGKRKLQPFHISDHDVDNVVKLASFWKNKALYGDIIPQKLLEADLIKGVDRYNAIAPNIAIQLGTNEGHICAGYEIILKKGYSGILKDAQYLQKILNKNDPEYQDKYLFYEAVQIYYKAAINFLKRFSILANSLAQQEKEPKRRKELELIADMMEKFTNGIPETFYEAVQLIHFTQNIANIIYSRSVIALGRLDQILWPYYKKDIESHKITREFALELIEELNLKLTWNITLLPTEYTTIANALGENTQTITISGVDIHDKDCTNELSYLFLEAYRNIKAFTTDLSVRIHQNTPEEFFKTVIQVFQSTSGIAFYNDDIIIPALSKAGYSIEDAQNYAIIGCVEPTSQGNTFAATGRMFMNLPGVLELTLNNGYCNFTQRIGGLQTGDPSNFTTFEKLIDAFNRQLQFNIEKSVKIAEVGDQETIKYFQQPFLSAFIEGCLEKGKDYTAGGAKYNYSSITAYGFATLVDSLYNIKKVIYEKKIMNLSDFVQILNADFEGKEDLQQKLINKYDKWGNDREEIDKLANQIWDMYCSEVVKHKPIRGGRYNPGAYSMGIHVMEGLFTRATADGRKATLPISNSLSPVNNRERNGITASLNSIAKLNYELSTNGVAVNIRIHPLNLQSEEGVDKFYHLMKGYFKNGGMQIQPNVVSTDTLRDAQKHPENYSDLIVKVGGYNATFIDLGVPIQNDIINRLEHSY